MLESFWYVIAENSAVGTTPTKVRALGQIWWCFGARPTVGHALSLAYRRLRGTYVERGFRVDHRAVRRACEEEDRLLVIPSPHRRDPELAKAWVLDEVPTR